MKNAGTFPETSLFALGDVTSVLSSGPLHLANLDSERVAIVSMASVSEDRLIGSIVHFINVHPLMGLVDNTTKSGLNS